MPAFVLFVGLIIFGGRTAIAHQAVESAAADAARSASSPEPPTTPAVDAANRPPRRAWPTRSIDCRRVEVAVDTSGFAAPVGQSGTVSVTVECRPRPLRPVACPESPAVESSGPR